MTEPTIADAAECIEQLLSVLDDAYWEANSIDKKDTIYAILALLQAERSEISKLSIQDHGLTYEPICNEFKEIKAKLNNLRKVMDETVKRVKTSIALDRLITQVTTLTN